MSLFTGTYQFSTTRWIRMALINFLVLALAGVVLRYKINFPLPQIDQKNLLHGHSHFAFVGWVALALMALMVNHLVKSGITTNYRKYHWLFIANTITAYGMLITFTLQGYAMLSITFSTLSIFVSYFFIVFYWKDLRKLTDEQHVSIWFKSALILLALSSAGPFTLAYLMANRIFVQDLYFSAIYFFLHFQYNGWFIFACFGLLFSYFPQKSGLKLLKINRQIFLVLAITVIPTYLLSILGLKVPEYMWWIAAISGIIQLAVVFYNHRLLLLIRFIPNLFTDKTIRYLWMLAYLSFSLKIILQSLSFIPYFADFAFSLRPVIIGYLHLCFLGVISFFILGCCNYVMVRNHMELNKTGLLIFIVGVLVQEGLLMVQALDAILFLGATSTNILLFLAAIMMAAGLSIVLIKFNYTKTNRPL